MNRVDVTTKAAAKRESATARKARRRKAPTSKAVPSVGPEAAAPPDKAATVAAPTDAAAAATEAPPLRLDELFPDYSGPKHQARSIGRRNQLVDELKRAYQVDGLVLYVGAGVSMSLGLPSWNELIQSLTIAMMSRRVTSAADQLAMLTEAERVTSLKALLEEVKEQKSSNKPVLMLARAIKDQLGDDLLREVATHLYGRLSLGGGFIERFFTSLLSRRSGANKDELKLPESPLLGALVALTRPQRGMAGVQAIVNYNFDDILEERLRRDDVPCVTVLSGKDRLTRGKLPSYHVHGVLPIREFAGKVAPKQGGAGNFVFSEDEYHLQYADPYRWSNVTQISLLGRHKGLFIGLSMQDPNLRRLIDVTHQQYPEIWNYAILPRSGKAQSDNVRATILSNLAEEVDETSFERIGVKVIWVDDITADVAPLLSKIAQLPDD